MNDFENDIPLSVAVAAYNGVSFDPDKRGATDRADYARTLEGDWQRLSAQAAAGGTSALLPDEFARYRDGYRKRFLAYLHSQSRCVSWFIAGPSNFPAARMNKRTDIAHKRLNELLDFRKRALEAINRALRPDLAPIMAGDSDALQRLAEELAALEAKQAHMLAVNKAHARYMKAPATLNMSGLSESDKELCRRYEPAYSWEPHPFAPFQLTNNGANIRRVKARIAQVSALKSRPVTQTELANGVRVEDDAPANRVRVFFPGKPETQVRDSLKRNGFRWAPSVGAWQGYRNERVLAFARNLAQVTP